MAVALARALVRLRGTLRLERRKPSLLQIQFTVSALLLRTQGTW